MVPEDVVLVLGNSGSGKSTLVKYLTAGKDSDLKVILESDELIIKGSKIGSGITSFTKVCLSV